MTTLTLAEELLLLALDESKGSVSGIDHGLCGALLMDLVLLQRLSIVDKRVVVIDRSPTGDALLDATLAEIAGSTKLHVPLRWVAKLGMRPGIMDKLCRRLVERGILREEQARVLGMFRVNRYPTVNGSRAMELRRRIRALALDEAVPDRRDSLLLSLIHACRLTDALFAKEERKRATERVRALVADEVIGQAVIELNAVG